MKKQSKRNKSNLKKIEKNKIYEVKEGLEILKTLKSTKFLETIEINFNLNINTKKTNQNIKGFVILPHGTGKNIKIAVFTTGKNIEIAKLCGVEAIGLEDLAEKIKKNSSLFDLIIASPETMKIVSKLGPILGPKGLMPNPKFGTITENIKKAIKEAKNGKVCYKNDKNGVIHSIVGKINFSNQKLYENIKTLFEAIKKSKPSQSKGFFIKKISISTTMGPGITINHMSL